MKERPVLFNGPMVRAILTGQKTQTRRVMKPQPAPWVEEFGFSALTPPGSIEGRGGHMGAASKFYRLPYGQVGDRLWVRESAYIAPPGFADDAGDALDEQGRRRVAGYAASMDAESVRCAGDFRVKCTPSIHMPRWASRIMLEVTDVRVQRLDAITDRDARAEGIPYDDSWFGGPTERAVFRDLWREIYGHASWDANPFVWAVTFRRVTP